MAACSYLASEQGSHLIMARSKLPSLKGTITIPKLELNACTLAARLTHSIFEQLRSYAIIQKVFIFSDSEIALSWLQSKPSKDVGQMVLNRLNEVRNLVDSLQKKMAATYALDIFSPRRI